MTCFNELGKEFTAQKHAILPQHFVRAAKLPSSPNSRNLGSTILHKRWYVRSCGPQHVINFKQMVHKSYIHLEFHFCTFLQHPRSYISELAAAVFTQILFVLSNHSRRRTCLASVLVLVNASVEVFFATNSSAQPLHRRMLFGKMARTPSRRNQPKNRCAQMCRNGAPKTVAFQLLMSSREELILVHIHVNPLGGG